MKQTFIIIFVLIAIVLIGGALCYTKQTKNKSVQNSSPESDVLKMESEIKNGVRKDYPYLETLEKENNSKLSIKTETLQGDFAIGRYASSEERLKVSDGTWFAQRGPNGWEVFNTSYGYFGVCQKFWQHNFPKDMMPDCWDDEKNVLVETSNPNRFFQNGFSIVDKESIKKAFITYLNMEAKDYVSFYTGKQLFVFADINTENHMKGRIFVGGIENRSTPFVLAAKVKGSWKIVYQGQDGPYCKIVDMYDFPTHVVPFCIAPDKDSEGEYITRWR